MSRSVELSVTVDIPDEVSAEEVASKLFDFLASDPGDVFPEIETVDTYNWHEVA